MECESGAEEIKQDKKVIICRQVNAYVQINTIKDVSVISERKKEKFNRINIYKGETLEERTKNLADILIDYINGKIDEEKVEEK